jgi:hypothetical protein
MTLRRPAGQRRIQGNQGGGSMRPKSIIMFERLFLASLVLGVLNFALSYEDAAAVIANDAGAQKMGLGGGFLVGVTAVSTVVYLLLWFLAARMASNIAKWILVVFVGLGVLSALPAMTGTWNATLALSLVVYALEVLALVYLFRPDAKAWLRGEAQADEAIPD